jgi:beta-N-acetylhexosaminidase
MEYTMITVDALLHEMSLDEKIGQMFLLAFAKNRLDEARVLFARHFVGAAYISNDNVPSPQAAAALVSAIQGYAANTRLQVPLLLGVDQEGAWSVMTPGSSPGPGNMALGATGQPDAARQMYGVIGRELRAVGLNTLLAPCADCNSNPHNSIIGVRSFGQSPALVARMTAAAVTGAHEGGIIATLKHFPGHGDTTLDSHRGLPTVNRSADALREIDLHPFAAGIQAGADMVMTAHIIFPAIDPDNPATLSSALLQGVLRGELGFDGVILSDSMNMRAMLAHFPPAEAAVRAFAAGVDLLMLAEEHYSHDAGSYLRQQTALLTAVRQALDDGRLSLARVDDAVRRVLTLKHAYGLWPGTPAPPLTAGDVGLAAHAQVELAVARSAVAVLRDRTRQVPLPRAAAITLVNTTVRSAYAILGTTRGIGPNQTVPAYDTFAEALRARFPDVVELTAEDILGGVLPGLGSIVAVTENYPLPGMDFDQTSQRAVMERLHAAAPERLIVAALRDPYELAALPDVGTYVCAFSFRPCAAQALVDVLSGEFDARGHSPVSVSGAASSNS